MIDVTKIYIAGKISGKSGYWKDFVEAEKRLEEAGYAVLNPSVLPEGMRKRDYMRICLSMIDSADGIYLLPGWEDSPGAQIEKAYAEYIGKFVEYGDVDTEEYEEC